MDWKTRSLRSHLKGGGVLAYPTRAVYGLGCDPRSQRGLRRLLRLKQRPAHKGMIVVSDALARLQPFHMPLSSAEQARCLSRWPGGHTWLIPASRRVSGLLRGRARGLGADRRPRVALRQDDYVAVQRLCHRLGMALVSTSANRSGQRPLGTTRACQRLFGHQVRVLSGRTQRHARPSTIQDLMTGKAVRG
ncbi:MAG: Sua5/YciO/YrdC/YwlC family protein [Ferrovum sp.]|nr:Sua5/YciO/YrdC/YwlC family protein [Ferrovum sp.]NDU86877.1 Sua5/YciO/YrdC/YwlC family protein [Ferrovum sp.]